MHSALLFLLGQLAIKISMYWEKQTFDRKKRTLVNKSVTFIIVLHIVSEG